MSTKQTEAQRLAGTLMRDVGSQLVNRKQAAALLLRQDELLKQALEALEASRRNMRDNAPHLSGKVWGFADETITAIRVHREAK